MFKTVVRHFDCVINRGCEGREPSVPVIVVEEKRSGWRQSGSFSSLETLGCVQRSLGCSHGDMSTEFGDEKTCFSPSAASSGGFPRMVRDIRLGCRPSLSPAWRISPRSIILEDLESVSTTLFCCSCMDYSFRLLFAFVSMCRSRQAQFFLQVYRNSLYKRNWHLFPSSPTAFRLLSHTLTPIFTPRWQPLALREYTKQRYYACKAEISKQLTRASTSVPIILCCAIHPLSRLHGALLRKPRNFILLASSNFILLHPGTQHHPVTPPIVRLTPLVLTSPQGQVSLAG